MKKSGNPKIFSSRSERHSWIQVCYASTTWRIVRCSWKNFRPFSGLESENLEGERCEICMSDHVGSSKMLIKSSYFAEHILHSSCVCQTCLGQLGCKQKMHLYIKQLWEWYQNKRRSSNIWNDMKRYKIIKRDLVWTCLDLHITRKITTKDVSARPSGRLVIVDFEATENARIFHKESERLGMCRDFSRGRAESWNSVGWFRFFVWRSVFLWWRQWHMTYVNMLAGDLTIIWIPTQQLMISIACYPRLRCTCLISGRKGDHYEHDGVWDARHGSYGHEKSPLSNGKIWWMRIHRWIYSLCLDTPCFRVSMEGLPSNQAECGKEMKGTQIFHGKTS